MEEKKKSEVKQRLLEVIELSKKDPILEDKMWDEYEKISQQYECLRHDHSGKINKSFVFHL